VTLDEIKDLAKSVLEALDDDWESQLLEDSEHIVRIRRVIDALVRFAESEGTATSDAARLQAELVAFAEHLFVAGCVAASRSEASGCQEEAESVSEVRRESRRSFRQVYRRGGASGLQGGRK
jgi:hypothetical protein